MHSPVSPVHVGAYPQSDTSCPPGSPNGLEKIAGVTATAIAAAATVTLTLTVRRKLKLSGMVIPEAMGINFNVTGIQIGDQEFVVGSQGTVTGGTLQDTGVGGEAFAPWGTCVNLIEGACIDSGTTITITAINRSQAIASLKVMFRGTTA